MSRQNAKKRKGIPAEKCRTFCKIKETFGAFQVPPIRMDMFNIPSIEQINHVRDMFVFRNDSMVPE